MFFHYTATLISCFTVVSVHQVKSFDTYDYRANETFIQKIVKPPNVSQNSREKESRAEDDFQATSTKLERSNENRRIFDPNYKKWGKVKRETPSRSRHHIELLLIVDHSLFNYYDRSVPRVQEHVLETAKILHELYQQLGVSVALVGLMIWSERDSIHVGRDMTQLLRDFGKHRRSLQNNFDVAHLLTGVQGESPEGVIGKAYTKNVCDTDDNVGVVANFRSPRALAAVLAHEIGHNLGLEHDGDHCDCTDCIMAGSTDVSKSGARRWSRCSQAKISEILVKHRCLENVPKKCGNMVLDDGEECDCGHPAFCQSPCCDPYTCKFKKGVSAQCFSGSCCNTLTCTFQPAGTNCRPTSGNCDLPEFCSGLDSTCPVNLHKFDGVTCDKQKICINGECQYQRRRDSTFPSRPSNCSGHGVCNNLGNCHCDLGYSPPFCNVPGYGGSEDSNIPFRSDDALLQGFSYYLTFLAIIPIVLFLVFLWLYGKSSEEKTYIKEKLYDCAQNGRAFVASGARYVAETLRNSKRPALPLATPQVAVEIQQDGVTLKSRKISLTLPTLKPVYHEGGFNALSNASTPSTPQSAATTTSPAETPRSAESGSVPLFPNYGLTGWHHSNHLSPPHVHFTRPAPPPPPY